jgi:hypothetical protein
MLPCFECKRGKKFYLLISILLIIGTLVLCIYHRAIGAVIFLTLLGTFCIGSLGAIYYSECASQKCD